MADLETIGVKAVVEGAAAYLSDLDKIASAEKKAANEAKGLGDASKASGKGMDAAGAAAGGAVKPIKQLDDQAAKTAATMKGFDKAVTALSLGALAGFGVGAVYAIKQAASFEHQINILGAVSGATADDLAAVQVKAKELGADLTLPGTSASDAAAAMTELAKSGLSVNDAMSASKGVLQLSAAAQIDNARAAEIASNALNAFKLPASEAVRISDLLAGAANASSAEINQVADSLQQSSAVFASAGIPIEDLTTAIAEMANAGIKGSDAGTSMKSMLLALEAPTKKAQGVLDDLGISVYDNNGKMVAFRDLIQQFSEKLGPLTQQERDHALAVVFGSDAIRAANIVLGSGVTAFDNLKDAVTRQGSAADLANAQMQGLSGSWEGFKSQMQTVAVDIGERTLPVLTNLTTGAANLMGAFDRLPASTQNLIIMSGVLAALAGPAYGAISKVVTVLGHLSEASAKTKVAIGAAGVAGGLMLIDTVVASLTGKGVIDHLMDLLDSGSRAENTANGIKKIALALQDISGHDEQVSHLSIVVLDAANDMERFMATFKPSETGNMGMWADANRQAANAGKEFDENFRGAVQTLADMKLPMGELLPIYQNLTGANKSLFAEMTGLDVRFEAGTAAMAKETHEVVNMGDELSRLAGNLTATAAAEPAADQAIADWAATVEVAKDGTQDFQKAIDGLIQTFADTNPVVIALGAENAKLQERIDQITGSTDKLSASQQLEVDALQAQIDKNNETIKPMADNQKAMEGQQKAAQNLLGPEGYGALLNRLNDLKVPQEDQIALQGHLSDAYLSLATNDIPAAVTEFQHLKDTLDPAVWAVLGAAAGPALMDAIKTSYTGPDKDKLIAAAQELIDSSAKAAIETARLGGSGLGSAMAAGVAAGIAAGKGAAVAAALDMMATIQAAASGPKGIDSGSPSKVWAKEIGEPITQGIVVGMLAAEPELLHTTTRIIEDMADASDTATKQTLLPAIAKQGDATADAYRQKLDQLRSVILTNLEQNKSMTDDEIKQLFATIIDTAHAAPLDAAFVSVIDNAIAAMSASLASGAGVANEQLAALINGLLSKVASGSAAIRAASGSLGAGAGAGAGAGGGGGLNGSVPQGGFAQPGGPATQGPQAGTTYKYASDVPGSTGGELPGVPGFDWVWVPGVGYHLEPKSYGDSGITSNPSSTTPGMATSAGTLDPTNHPGLVWNGSKWITFQAWTGLASPATFSQAVNAADYFLDPNSGKMLPKDQYTWNPTTHSYVQKTTATSGSFALGALSVPHDGLYKLHADETVVPKRASAMFLSRLLEKHGITPSAWDSARDMIGAHYGRGNPLPGSRRGDGSSGDGATYQDIVRMPTNFTPPPAGPTIALDLRGSSFNGSPEDNAAAIESKVRQVIALQYGGDAFAIGVRSTWAM